MRTAGGPLEFPHEPIYLLIGTVRIAQENDQLQYATSCILVHAGGGQGDRAPSWPRARITSSPRWSVAVRR
jgi:hypothetical protein